VAAALATGLRSRPLEATVRDTLAWFQTLPAERQVSLRAGLAATTEARTLREWHSYAKRHA